MSRGQLLARIALKGLLGLGIVGAMLFGIAGRFDWLAAWVFLAMLGSYLLLGTFWFFRSAPALLEERMTTAPNVPSWDRVVVRAYWASLAALFATAALDAGRFRWSEMRPALQGLGGTVMLAAFAVIWWCTSANPFLSSNARLQRDRGQTVVDRGPYRVVRHPMYTSLIALTLAISFLLGSWLAVGPACLIGILLILRAALEDRMLLEELDDYREYARRVNQRLLPGLW